MKFIIKGLAKENIYNLMRRSGYFPLSGNENEFSFVRRLSAGDYPRFHVYLKIEGEDLALNLHLDQKKPVYRSAPAHAGEYDGELLDEEARRIKETIKKLIP